MFIVTSSFLRVSGSEKAAARGGHPGEIKQMSALNSIYCCIRDEVSRFSFVKQNKCISILLPFEIFCSTI